MQRAHSDEEVSTLSGISHGSVGLVHVVWYWLWSWLWSWLLNWNWNWLDELNWFDYLDWFDEDWLKGKLLSLILVGIDMSASSVGNVE